MGITLIGREGHLFIQQTGTLSLFIGLMCSATRTELATGIWMIISQLDQSWTYLNYSTFLPSLEEHAKLRADYIILVLRILVKECEYFKKFSKFVPGHIPHQFSKEMRKQSQVVS